jgi:RimJ/RimL family protein N-acetyltransferase
MPRPDSLTDGSIALRPFTLDDVPAVTAACQDPEISKWRASIPWPYNESNARDWIATHAHKWAHGESAQFAVVSAGGDRFWDHSDSTSLIGVKERRWVNTGSLVQSGSEDLPLVLFA